MTIGGDLPRFYEVLGRSAEFVYGATAWELEVMALLRAGELVPLTRRYPGPGSSSSPTERNSQGPICPITPPVATAGARS